MPPGSRSNAANLSVVLGRLDEKLGIEVAHKLKHRFENVTNEPAKTQAWLKIAAVIDVLDVTTDRALLPYFQAALLKVLADFSSAEAVLQIVTALYSLQTFEPRRPRPKPKRFRREKSFLEHIAASDEEDATEMARRMTEMLKLENIPVSQAIDVHAELYETVGFYACQVFYGRCLDRRISIRMMRDVTRNMIAAHEAFHGKHMVTNIMLRISCTPINVAHSDRVEFANFSPALLRVIQPSSVFLIDLTVFVKRFSQIQSNTDRQQLKRFSQIQNNTDSQNCRRRKQQPSSSTPRGSGSPCFASS
jgi:hypothetical protein